MEKQIDLQLSFFDEGCVNDNVTDRRCSIDVVITDINEAYPFLSRTSLTYKLCLCAITLLFTLLGLFLKSFIFRFLCSPSETSSTINLLIFTQQFYRVTMAIYYIWFGVAYLLPFSLEDLFGGSFCPFFSAVGTFSIFGDIYWSSALAFTRLLYIKHNKWLRFSSFLLFDYDLPNPDILLR
jgi:hypothetical protein